LGYCWAPDLSLISSHYSMIAGSFCVLTSNEIGELRSGVVSYLTCLPDQKLIHSWATLLLWYCRYINIYSWVTLSVGRIDLCIVSVASKLGIMAGVKTWTHQPHRHLRPEVRCHKAVKKFVYSPKRPRFEILLAIAIEAFNYLRSVLDQLGDFTSLLSNTEFYSKIYTR